MTVYEIPLTPDPQTFSISLAGTIYRLSVTWNKFGSYWVLDIADAHNVPVLSGTPLLPGQNLLAQYESLGLDGKLFVVTDHDPLAPPTFDNLGITSHLYFAPK